MYLRKRKLFNLQCFVFIPPPPTTTCTPSREQWSMEKKPCKWLLYNLGCVTVWLWLPSFSSCTVWLSVWSSCCGSSRSHCGMLFVTASLSVRSFRTLALAFLATKKLAELNKNGQSKKIIRQSLRHSIFYYLFLCCACVWVWVWYELML